MIPLRLLDPGPMTRAKALALADGLLRAYPGSFVLHGWECARCGARLLLIEPNSLPEQGNCGTCGAVQDLQDNLTLAHVLPE